jgi:uncharacterized alpha-E superfamily protein
MSAFYRESLRVHSTLALMTPDAMTRDVYINLERDLEKLSDSLARTYLA